MKIRQARLRDVKQIVAMQRQLAEHHIPLSEYVILAADASQKFETYLKKQIKDKKNARVSVAETDGRVVGYIMSKIEQDPPIYKVRTRGQITDTFVKKGYRKKGIARQLVKTAFSWFKEKKITFAQIEVYTKNKLGKTAWQKMGFKPYMIEMRRKL